MSDIILTDKQKADLLDLLWANSLIGLAKVSKDNIFLDVNQFLCDIVGYSKAELVGQTWMSITHPDDIAGDAAMTDEVTSGKLSKYAMSKRYKHKFGAWVPIYLKVTGYFDEGDFTVFLVQIVEKKVIEEPGVAGAILKEEMAASIKEYKENLKWVVGAIIGATLTAVGAFADDSLTQNAGLAILATVFGGITLNKKNA